VGTTIFSISLHFDRGLASVEARAFLRLPPSASPALPDHRPRRAVRTTLRGRAFAISRAIADALAEAYLRHRGVSPAAIAVAVFRFQSRRYHPETDDALRLLLVA
jgi:hypothetical protein